MRRIPDHLEAARPHAPRVASLLLRWQAEHDPDDFAALVTIIHEPLQRLAASTLRRDGIRDPGARDDAVALVLERLFRLGKEPRADGITPFDVDRHDDSDDADPGWAYVRCVARSRAHDVARAVRRRDRRACDYARMLPARTPAADQPAADTVDAARLQAALDALDERSRAVLAMMLDGKSQAAIAHVIGVCEGTVSRIRARAIARLRAVLAGKSGGGG